MVSRKKVKQALGLNRAVLALSAARMADAVGNSILFIIIPLYVVQIPTNHLHLPTSILVGILISVYGFIIAFFQPFMGALSDRLNMRKGLIMIGLMIICLSTALFSLAENYMSLFFLRIMQGIGVALTIPASMSLMTAVSEQESRGSAMGFFSSFRMIGFTLGPLLGGFLQVHYGFDYAFYTGAAMIFLSFLLIQCWVKEVKIPNERTTKSRFAIFDFSLYSKGIFTGALAVFSIACCFSMITTLENAFNERLGMNAVVFSIAFSTMIGGRLLFQVPLGYWSDRRGRRPFVIAGLIGMALSTALMGEVQSVTQLIILRSIQGISAAAVVAPVFALAADLTKKGGEGRQMSIVTMGLGLGLAVGPLLSGVLAVHSFLLPFLVIGGLTLVSTLVVYLHMPETVKRAS